MGESGSDFPLLLPLSFRGELFLRELFLGGLLLDELSLGGLLLGSRLSILDITGLLGSSGTSVNCITLCSFDRRIQCTNTKRKI